MCEPQQISKEISFLLHPYNIFFLTHYFGGMDNGIKSRTR